MPGLGTAPPEGDFKPIGASSRSQSRRPARGPGPEEVVAADGAEGVQDLAAEKKVGTQTALQGAGIDLGEGHAAAGDLGFGVALVARPREWMVGQGLDETAALFAAELRKGTVSLDARINEKSFGQPVGEVAAEEPEGGAGGLPQELVPGAGFQRGPLHADRLRRSACQTR